ncbi:hypothetical protein KAM398_18960 [Acinetobacter sp. KAM398]|jgi:hypothetical protein|uniref:hypothetical protein n=1 Tax=Acinetobacter TaxID=469 RepID=UPI0010C78980|nr:MULTISPECIES: hypothetical protein [Acinetobacter]QCP29839.1 hypothetical protein FDF20_01745 [Acinetobacter baumannii]CAI6141082.1 hypothetical protein DJICPGNB_03025 [Acinetobacter baumannii]GJC31917.1 hypothetical protein KAM392_18960 [Acinetobacter sp. KAM392]GJC34766.1 hypothetical protein KAM393_19350 [Acinetobacter sp. KAM393]GJC37547.1 hypothetical protein KAM394_18870 [Acinetobacter sp. KAM394]
MNIALAIKNWKFIVMAALAIALAFSVTSCTSKSHQIDLLESQKTLAETQRDLLASQRANEVHEVEQAWSQELLESERNANKNLQVALAAASDSALAVDRLSKQISDTNKRLSSGTHEAIVEYGKTCNFVLKTMADRGGKIAAAADGHAIDAERLDQAWPQQVKPDKQS